MTAPLQRGGSAPARFEPDAGLLRLLMETGYLASGAGLPLQAEAIFDGICAVRPESELPVIGLALVRMNRGEPAEAARLLREKALKLNPESDLAKSFLGVALRLAGSSREGETVLEEVIRSGRDETATRMAQSMLEQKL